jgi:hypothetical protein
MDNRWWVGALGIAVVAVVCFDVFHSIIVPRLSLSRARLASMLVGEILWPTYRAIVHALPQKWRTAWLDLFAPMAFLMVLATWLLLMISGFALVIYSLGDFIHPPVYHLADAAYFAGTSVLTLGYGDVVAREWPARVTVLLAAVLGLIFMALVVSLLFSMLSYLQQREQIVNTLMSRAGAPASGVVLLMRYRELNIVHNLSSAFVGWEVWMASILESHRSFPLLMYFRSATADTSWLAAVGATLDAASLLLTAVEKDWVGEADLYYWMGVSTLKAIAEAFEIKPVDDANITREQFDDALELLRSAGYEVRDGDKIWPYFQARRSGYMRHLAPLAERFETAEHVWLPSFKKMTL